MGALGARRTVAGPAFVVVLDGVDGARTANLGIGDAALLVEDPDPDAPLG